MKQPAFQLFRVAEIQSKHFIADQTTSAMPTLLGRPRVTSTWQYCVDLA